MVQSNCTLIDSSIYSVSSKNMVKTKYVPTQNDGSHLYGTSHGMRLRTDPVLSPFGSVTSFSARNPKEPHSRAYLSLIGYAKISFIFNCACVREWVWVCEGMCPGGHVGPL